MGPGAVGPRTVELPRLLLSARDQARRQVPAGAGVLAHDLSLIDLVRMSASTTPLAVDVDTVEGLGPDEAAIEFLARRLAVGIVVTRRPLLAARSLDFGCLALLHVHCLDSTGLERALSTHPGPPVGTAVSPGLILAHLAEHQRRRLPRPVLAYGLLRRPAEREAALAAGADALFLAHDEMS